MIEDSDENKLINKLDLLQRLINDKFLDVFKKLNNEISFIATFYERNELITQQKKRKQDVDAKKAIGLGSALCNVLLCLILPEYAILFGLVAFGAAVLGIKSAVNSYYITAHINMHEKKMFEGTVSIKPALEKLLDHRKHLKSEQQKQGNQIICDNQIREINSCIKQMINLTSTS